MILPSMVGNYESVILGNNDYFVGGNRNIITIATHDTGWAQPWYYGGVNHDFLDGTWVFYL